MKTKILVGAVIAVALIDIGFAVVGRIRSPVVGAATSAQLPKPIASGLADAEKPDSPHQTSSVGFRIAPSKTKAGEASWLATYSLDGHVARFILELDPASPISDKLPIRTGDGRFYSVPQSDSAGLLSALQKELKAHALPANVKHADSLPFKYVILASNNSKSMDGGFTGHPSGDWTAMKIFFGDDEGEVFLNINASAGVREFTYKDPDYGDIVLRYLATVL